MNKLVILFLFISLVFIQQKLNAMPLLVAAYDFDQGSGNLLTDQVNGHNGTIDGATWTPNGKYGGALSFDGNNDMVTITDASDLDFTNGMTIEAWVNPNGLSDWTTVVLKERENGLAYGLYASDNSNNPPVINGRIGNSDRAAVANSALLLGQWSHIAGTYDGTILRIYVNGIQVSTSNVGGILTVSNNPLRIGGNTVWGEYFNGLIDNVRIYSVALSESEIQFNMNTPVAHQRQDSEPPTVSDPVSVQVSIPPEDFSFVITTPIAAYNFDQGSGNLLTDQANGHNGTIDGATWTLDGKYGGALSFDGNNDMVTIADASDLDFTNGMTIEAWVNPNGLSDWTTVVLKERDNGLAYALYASDNSNNPPAIYGRIDNSDRAAVANNTLPLGQWRHIAGTYDGTILRFYVNGIQVNTSPVGGNLTVSSNPLRIGGNTVWSEYFNGRIDNVRIYSVALSESEIQFNMNTPIASGQVPVVPVLVPYIVGSTQAAAQTAITNADLVVGIVTLASSATVPAGNIISQNPVADASVAPNSTIDIVVSMDPVSVLVPNVVGLAQGTAEMTFTNAGLAVGTVSQTNSATVPAGNIISQNPVANASVPSGSAVDLVVSSQGIVTNTVLRYHKLVIDNQNKILPWYTPNTHAYSQYLDQLWAWLPTVPNGPGSSLPMYYLYNGFYPAGFFPGESITPDFWENDWGERVPNFVEFGRLYYAYKGDMGPLNIAKGLIDYALIHAMTPSDYDWPNFPFGTANAGATEINGDNLAWNQDDILIDLGSDMGMSFYKMYLIYGDPAYKTAAINTADILASKIQTGDTNNSPWPYVVNASTGAVISKYTSNWAGALTLFDLLIENEEPNSAAYATARQTLKNWILQYPMQNGNWVDGHSDVRIDGITNWSNTSKSNMNLYLLDNPTFDPNFMNNVPKLLKWTEDNFVFDGGSYPSVYSGAYVVSEQIEYREKMGYQTSRLAAEYAKWYEITGDSTYKDRAYRGFNYSTYMMKSSGESSDGPSDKVGFWWGDIYGEGPRMFFYGFSSVPEWAPPRENHILYSKAVLNNIVYMPQSVQYATTSIEGSEYLRLAFLPNTVKLNGVSLPLRTDLNAEGYTVRSLGNGDYSVNIRRAQSGSLFISGD